MAGVVLLMGAVGAWITARGVAGSPLKGDYGLRDSQPADFDAAALADGMYLLLHTLKLE